MRFQLNITRVVGEEGEESFEELKVDFFMKDSAIDGVWAGPDLDELYVYAGGEKFIIDYDFDMYQRLVELVGHKLEKYGSGIS